MPATPHRVYKNRTLRFPAALLQRVQVKLAKEDRKLNGLVIEQLERWAVEEPGDGSSPGQRLVRDMTVLRRTAHFKVPRRLDTARLMGDSDE